VARFGLWLLLIEFFGAQVGAAELTLLQGQRHMLSGTGAIWIEDSGVLQGREKKGGVEVEGRKPGHSEVRMGSQTWDVQVLNLEQQRTAHRLTGAVSKTLGLHVVTTGGHVEVQGHLKRWSDWKQLADSCGDLLCDYQMRAEINEGLFIEAQQKINESLLKHALPLQKIEPTSPPSLHLGPQNAHRKQLQRLLAAYGLSLDDSPAALELAPLVQVQITVAEVKRDQMLRFGLQWPNSLSANLLNESSPLISDLTVTAQALESAGVGRVLASPTLLCRSGKEAEFLAGGEFPIKVINFHLEDVIWKKYGVMLHVAPVADFSGRMSISLQTEVSSIDPHQMVDGIPGLFTNRLVSHFDLSRPQTIALSGLIKSEDSEFSEGLPFLRRIPILGNLFGSKDFQTKSSELVIFVRPTVLSPESTMPEPLLPNWKAERSTEGQL